MAANKSVKDLAVTWFSLLWPHDTKRIKELEDGDGRESRVRTRGVMGAVLEKWSGEPFCGLRTRDPNAVQERTMRFCSERAF